MCRVREPGILEAEEIGGFLLRGFRTLNRQDSGSLEDKEL